MIFSSEKQIWILSVWIVVANARQINKREIIELVDNKRVNTTAARFVDDGCFEWMCKENEVCNEYGFCVCNEPFARYNYETDQCEECGLDGHSCTSCCVSDELQCFENVCQTCYNDDGDYICNSKSTIITTASQIALSVGMIVGILILFSILYRICTKPNHLATNVRRRNRNSNDSSEISRRETIRASLSSIQVRVLARLQNRPPQYETQRDYEERNNQVTDIERQATSRSAVQGEAPPSYETERDEPSIGELPPPYSIAVISPTIDCSVGPINEGFVSDENVIAVISNNSDNNSSNNSNTTNLDSVKCDNNYIVNGLDSETIKSLHI